jgi:hypothetical protein
LSSSGSATSIFGYVGEQVDSYINFRCAIWLMTLLTSGFRHIGIGHFCPMRIVPQPHG